MEEKFEDFFKILFDPKPEFTYEYLEIYEEKTGKLFDFTYVFKYKSFTNPRAFQSELIKEKDRLLLDLKLKLSTKEINKSYINNLLDELIEVKGKFRIYSFDGLDYSIHKNTEITNMADAPIPIKMTIYELTNINENYRESFLKYNQSRLEIIDSLTEELQIIKNSIPGESLLKDKLKIKLSVADIALLFRLLDEEKLLNYKNKTEVYRFISGSFETEKQNEISEASVKNKFLSPDNTALKNIEILLSNFKLQIKKM